MSFRDRMLIMKLFPELWIIGVILQLLFKFIKKKTKLDWNRNMEQIGQVRMCKLKIDTVKNSNQTDVN